MRKKGKGIALLVEFH